MNYKIYTLVFYKIIMMFQKSKYTNEETEKVSLSNPKRGKGSIGRLSWSFNYNFKTGTQPFSVQNQKK